MVLPMHLVHKFYSKLFFYSCTVSNFEQYILAHFISEGYFEKHINRMRNYYQNKRDLLLHAIHNSPLASYVTISEEDAGLHFLLKVDTNLSDHEFLLNLEQQGNKLSALSQYYRTPPKESEHIFVVNYSFVKEDAIDKAITIIYQTIFKCE